MPGEDPGPAAGAGLVLPADGPLSLPQATCRAGGVRPDLAPDLVQLARRLPPHCGRPGGLEEALPHLPLGAGQVGAALHSTQYAGTGRVADYFSMEIRATRLNWYRDSSQWKPFHHDAAAMNEEKVSLSATDLWYKVVAGPAVQPDGGGQLRTGAGGRLRARHHQVCPLY